MSYQVLARKWRPKTFSQLIGQESVSRVLINSLDQQRLHHAYLFTGTRGVGKTSVARLLAKALNCESGISSLPCLECDACLSIEQGCFIDLIEIDGASKTRVEDIRELLENVQYLPTNGRFKIYLIDEVHMLSQHSFNALLKTLEEPPHHVKFLLATTDPQKLPLTILSRCLQFSLRNISPELISQHLHTILRQEQLSFEPEAVDLLSKAAKGSMRDALSLLDQVIPSFNTILTTQNVNAILGYTQQDYALQLLQALTRSDAEQMIYLSRQIAVEGGHFQYVLDELLHYLHQISICQNLTDDSPFTASSSEIKMLAHQFAPEEVQLFYQIGMKGSEDFQLAPTFAIGFEMTILRMLTFRPAPYVATPTLAYELAEPSPQQTLGKHVAELQTEPMNKLLTRQEIPLIEANISPDHWKNLLNQLKLKGLTLTAAENAEWVSKSGKEILLRVAYGHQSLFTATVKTRLEEALTIYYNESIKIALSTEKAVESSPAQQRQVARNQQQHHAELILENDPLFQQLKHEFSAELGSIDTHCSEVKSEEI